jgi:hypothetical protein
VRAGLRSDCVDGPGSVPSVFFLFVFRFDSIRARDINVYRIWVVRPVIIRMGIWFFYISSALSAATGASFFLYRDKIYNKRQQVTAPK